MATNPYFKSYDSKVEQSLINDLTIETIKAMGRDVIYIPRDYLIIDNLFGEDPESKFSQGYPIEMYMIDTERFQGNRDIVAKFGIQITDRTSLSVSKTRFQNEITSHRNEIKKPREGDLIYFPLSGSLFEINFVEDETPFYQLGGLTTYTLNVELFTYSGENIDTGITEIDSIETLRKTYATLAYMSLDAITGSNKITDGELVYQVLGITGVGATLSIATSTATALTFIRGSTQSSLYIFGISGGISYGTNQTIKGSVSGAEYYFKGSSSISNLMIPTDPYTKLTVNDNDVIKTESINIFDFTDIDPFSEGKY